MTEEDIFQAGYEAAASATPMPDETAARLAVILAPLAESASEQQPVNQQKRAA